ncbi:MAG: conjugal transfer protein TraG N-terminal domain-containing protein, partial [Chlamydiales bacterium]
MISYFDPSGGVNKTGRYLTCQETLKEITPLFEKEKAYYSQHELLKHLPLTYQVLTGIKKDNEELIGQQIMLGALSKGMTASNIAKLRAEAHQKSTYQVMGSMASNSLITMRVVLEALIYGSFIIVIPLALIPGGIKFVLSWVWLSVWIQLWPPFYAILNYIMQIAAKSFAASIMFGLSGDQIGMSLFTSAGLQNLHENISATAGYLSLSIPFISYTILQGAQSFVHLASTLAAPAQSAATGAAAEMTSGNYSFANTSFGQMSYQNTTALQSNTAPSISSGYTTETHGNYAITHAADGTTVVKQNDSTLISSLSSDKAISESLQHSYQTAKTHVNSEQQNYSDAISQSSRSMEDLTNHIGKSSSFVEGCSEREASALQESCGYMRNTVDNFASQHGVSTSQAYDMLVSGGTSASAGINLFGNGAIASLANNHNFSHGVGSSDALNAAMSISSSEDFQKHFNNISEFSKNSSHSLADDQGIRIASGFTESLDALKSSQQNYQNAFNEMTQASQNLNWAESNSHQIRRSLNQSFVDWSKEQLGYGQTVEMLQSKCPEERERMMGEFLNQHVSHLRQEAVDPRQSFENSTMNGLNFEEEATSMTARAVTRAQEHNLTHSPIQDSHQSIETRLDLSQTNINQQFNSAETIHSSKLNTLQSDFDSKRGESRITRMKDELFSGNAIGNAYQDKSSSIIWLQD